jgi:hypothetical protein
MDASPPTTFVDRHETTANIVQLFIKVFKRLRSIEPSGLAEPDVTEFQNTILYTSRRLVHNGNPVLVLLRARQTHHNPLWVVKICQTLFDAILCCRKDIFELFKGHRFIKMKLIPYLDTSNFVEFVLRDLSHGADCLGEDKFPTAKIEAI